MHPTASAFVVVGMGVLPLLVAAALASKVKRPAFAIGFLVWLALLAALALSGALRRFDARPTVLVVLGGAALAVVLARGSIGTALVHDASLAAIIGFQGFRLPLELVMHRAATEGTMPEQMTFTGLNFDIVSGTTALIVAAMVARGIAPRGLVIAWAVLSSTLLAVVVVIAFASVPAVAAFGHDPAQLNTWITFFPFVWLPGVLVPAALFGQIVVARKLRLSPSLRP